MKTSSYLLFAGQMVVGLLFMTSCASAQFGDSMAHNASGSGTASLGNCTLHMPVRKTRTQSSNVQIVCGQFRRNRMVP